MRCPKKIAPRYSGGRVFAAIYRRKLSRGSWDDCLILDKLNKKVLAALSDMSKILGELILFDDEKVILVRLDQPKIVKTLHK
jgi:hypothetical protein